MHKRLWLSAVMLVVAGGLLVVAGFAGAASSKPAAQAKGGTLHFVKSTDIDYVDPAKAYFTDSWELEYATQAKLMNYPDKQGAAGSTLVPEIAKGFPKVSPDGRTYTFTVRPGFKYNTGKAVTAQDFANALNRDANPAIQSPATAYMHDIAGAEAVITGKAKTISGVKVSGNKLTVALTKPAPDFVARMAMPFFSPVPAGLPVDAQGINDPPSAGPYYVASRIPSRSWTLKRNPNYKGTRPQNVDQITATIGGSLESNELQVEQGSADYTIDSVPPADNAILYKKYFNKQFYVKTLNGTSFFALNTSYGSNKSNPLFKDNVPLRKAVNYAIDRPALVRQGGFLSGKRTDQLLPPGISGFEDASLYPLKGVDLKTAKKYAAGHTKDGKAVLYTGNRGARPLRAQVLQFNLKQIGIDLDVKQFARAVQHDKDGVRGEPFDITDEGWISDYADPVTFIGTLLDGNNIQATGNNNQSYFNDPAYNKKIEAAARMTGPARYKAFAQLDIDITKNQAPMASFQNINDIIFVSKHVGCFTFNNVFLVDYAALCRK